ncbi:MAG: hypothetical protein KGK07_13440 [Chloroflexota bacterium]|nr:hypothetical protein [Chloroflexota bacterium]
MADLRQGVARAFGVPDTEAIVARLDARLAEMIEMQRAAVEQLIVAVHLLDEMARAEARLERRLGGDNDGPDRR